MDLGLAGKTIAIAGSTGGIGVALVSLLAGEQARLLLVGGRPERLTALAASLPPELLLQTVHGDFRKQGDRARCVDALLQAPGVDGFVFMPAELRTDEIGDARSSEFRETFEVNFFSAFELSQAALTKAEHGASFVFISSIDAHRHPSHPASASYDSSKRALESLSESIAIESGSRSIRSNCVVPGLIRTPMTEDFFSPQFDTERGRFLEAVPLARAGTPDETASVVMFLLSPASGYVSGSTVVVDGGFLRQGL
ncbi:MAG: SDR family NAD(P)-dependent oxidoreductase [Candidatus Cryosericum sp.]